MAITAGVAPHNGWLEINGQRYQVIRGQVEFNTLNASNTLSASLPLNAPGYFDAIAPLTGYQSVQVKAIVLSGGSEATLMTAWIQCITFQLTATTILIQGSDGFSSLNDHTSTDTWTNKKGSEIVQDLAHRLGIPFKAAAAGSTMAGKKVKDDYVKLTDNVSYLTTMHKLAHFDGVRLYMDENGTLNYGPPGTGGSYSVFWRRPTPQTFMVSDCIDLRVNHNLEASATHEQTISSYKPSTKQSNTATATSQGQGQTKQYYESPPNYEQEQSYQLAKAQADQRADHEWELFATVVGDPSIKSSMSVQLGGTGTVLDQTYPIDAVIHRFGLDGYTTQINAKGKGNRAGAS